MILQAILQPIAYACDVQLTTVADMHKMNQPFEKHV